MARSSANVGRTSLIVTFDDLRFMSFELLSVCGSHADDSHDLATHRENHDIHTTIYRSRPDETILTVGFAIIKSHDGSIPIEPRGLA
jgi:hypothetical protein